MILDDTGGGGGKWSISACKLDMPCHFLFSGQLTNMF